jgi:hypothetical protein
LLFIQFLYLVLVLFQMAGKNGIYISADGDLLVGNDIHDTGNLVMYFPADIDALACFDLVAFEECRRVIDILSLAAASLFRTFRRRDRLRLRSFRYRGVLRFLRLPMESNSRASSIPSVSALRLLIPAGFS